MLKTDAFKIPNEKNKVNHLDDFCPSLRQNRLFISFIQLNVF